MSKRTYFPKEHLPDFSSLQEAMQKNRRLHSVIVGLIQCEFLGKKKKDLAISLNISEPYLYNIRKKYLELIKGEVGKLKQSSGQKGKNNITIAKEFLQEHAMELAARLYFVAMTGSDREARQAAKDGLAIAGVTEAVQEPPDISKKMQAIMFNIFYGEQKGIPAIDGEGKPIIDLESSHESPNEGEGTENG